MHRPRNRKHRRSTIDEFQNETPSRPPQRPPPRRIHSAPCSPYSFGAFGGGAAYGYERERERAIDHLRNDSRTDGDGSSPLGGLDHRADPAGGAAPATPDLPSRRRGDPNTAMDVVRDGDAKQNDRTGRPAAFRRPGDGARRKRAPRGGRRAEGRTKLHRDGPEGGAIRQRRPHPSGTTARASGNVPV